MIRRTLALAALVASGVALHPATAQTAGCVRQTTGYLCGPFKVDTVTLPAPAPLVVRVTDSLYCVGAPCVWSKTPPVVVAPPAPPATPTLFADFTVSCPTLQCSLDASASHGAGSIVSYAWSWGNGRSETHTTPTVKSTWAAAGTYTITLTITDSAKHQAVVAKSIAIGMAPPVTPPAPPPPPPVTPPTPPASPPSPPPVSSGSLTHPMFVPAASLLRWSAMKASGHPWLKLTESNCAATGTANERNSDNGSYCAAVAAYEHDTTAARKAYDKIVGADPLPLDLSLARQECTDRILMADLIDWALTPAQRGTVLAQLNGWITYAMRVSPSGIRKYDSDHSTTLYGCMAMLDAFTRGLATPTHWLDSTMTAPNGDPPYLIGGLGSTVPTSLRQTAESRFAMGAKGGVWRESSQYDLNTALIMATFWAALRNAYGVDSLPTLGSYLRQYASLIAFDVTPDLRETLRWGDDQLDALWARIWRTNETAAMLAGVTGDPAAYGLVARLNAMYQPVGGFNTAEPLQFHAWFMPWFDPSAPIDSTPRQGIRLSTGSGHLWDVRGATEFYASAEQPTNEDHQPSFTFDFQLYRHGEWALQGPRGYDGFYRTGASQNGVSYAGIGAMLQRGWERFDTTGGVSCVTGSTSGGLYDPSRTDLGYPPFLTIGRRSTCYTQVSGTDVVVTKDSVVIGIPQNLNKAPGFGGYYSSDSAQIDPKGGWFAVVHPQTIPVRAGNTWTWTTLGGQAVTLSAFGPNVTADSLVADSTVAPGHAGYQLRLRSAGVLFTVTQVGTPLPVSQIPNGVAVGARTITFP